MTVIVVGGSREATLLLDRLTDVRLADPDSLPERFDATAVIDASHPCERRTQSEVSTLCKGIPLLRLRRPAWQATSGDHWIEVNDATHAREAIRREGWKRVFLCLGAGDRQAFEGDDDRWYLVRTRSTSPKAISLADYTITAKGGPFTVGHEIDLMTEHRIDALVTRNAGGDGAAPKIHAARALGVPVVLLNRPPCTAPEVESVEEALAWLGSAR